MRLLNALLLIGVPVGAVAAQTGPAPVAEGQQGASDERVFDSVGYAGIMTLPSDESAGRGAVAVTLPTLAPGNFVEVTALDSGRTIVALVVAGEADGAVAALSSGAARQLGVGTRAGVRVRSVVPSGREQAALHAGKVAAARPDASAILLTALRQKLPQGPDDRSEGVLPRGQGGPIIAADATASAHGKARGPSDLPKPVRGAFVQVAALSSAERAATLAQQLGGRVVPGGGVYRVLLGPYADQASATRARDGIVQRGYGDARVTFLN